ncbi:MAG: sulfotransferase [Candidatus Accumulibacter sp.]|nr:sulfotransferase [Accumulibacter sp.]MCM8625119.1 sulfotransferase [Accumulibacter sp.]
METGQLHAAEASLRQALRLRPGFFEALSDLGAVLLMMGRVSEAPAVLQQALGLRPDSPEVLANLANLLELDEQVEQALQLYQRALTARPDSPDVLAKQAELLEKAGRLDEARDSLARGLALDPEHPLLNLVTARIDRREGRHAEAAARLEATLVRSMSESTRGEIHLLLGQIYDRLGMTERVLAHLVEGKRRTAAAADPEGAGQRRFLAKIDASRAWASARLPDSAGALPPSPDSPIFLIGFPRSGTTLLEQVLDSHPALQTLDEKPCAAVMEQTFLALTDGGPAALADLSGEQVLALRQAYWEEAGRHVTLRPDVRLVDKLPLNTVRVPLLWRVFPEARFILAIRHPCDVTLSCLMQSFGPNEAMAGFISLEGVAEIYAQVMGAWREFAERLPLRTHRIRYEDLVTDFEAEAGRLLSFLGVRWDDAVLDHTRHAREKAVITTPSYHQVTQPLYRHARYRWRRYERELAPVLGLLRPFIEYFGYAEDA